MELTVSHQLLVFLIFFAALSSSTVAAFTVEDNETLSFSKGAGNYSVEIMGFENRAAVMNIYLNGEEVSYQDSRFLSGDCLVNEGNKCLVKILSVNTDINRVSAIISDEETGAAERIWRYAVNSAPEPSQRSTSVSVELEDIGAKKTYGRQSSIFRWFNRIADSVKSIFVDNTNKYEDVRELNKEHRQDRNDKIVASTRAANEPPYNPTMCRPDNANDPWRACSCGDGVCASYEDKCSCPSDCGSCSGGFQCRRGECVEFVANTCMNEVCESGEEETCPWDCLVLVEPEEEEK